MLTSPTLLEVRCVEVHSSIVMYSLFRSDPQAPALGVGSSIVVSILPSDDAFGVFGFTNDSLAHLVSERDGGTPVALSVSRRGGSFGEVGVHWRVMGPVGDITPASGVVVFGMGQTEGSIMLTVADDLVSLLWV